MKRHMLLPALVQLVLVSTAFAQWQVAAGQWSVQWNGEDDRGQRVASGVYFYRMRAGSFVDTKKMVLLK